MIKLTNNAVQHFKNIILNNQPAIGIKIGVKKAGCSGMTYTVNLAESENDKNVQIYTFDNLKVLVDNSSLDFLKGLTLDCTIDGLNTNIKFINPNATGECGCGESFSTN